MDNNHHVCHMVYVNKLLLLLVLICPVGCKNLIIIIIIGVYIAPFPKPCSKVLTIAGLHGYYGLYATVKELNMEKNGGQCN